MSEIKIEIKKTGIGHKMFIYKAYPTERRKTTRKEKSWPMTLLADREGGGVEPIPTQFLFQGVNQHV
jgi:hypothetical protein